MKRSINYKDTLIKWYNLTPICGEPTFETLQNLWDEIKANAKSVYSNLWGGAHGHLSLVLTYAQYALILPTPFVYPTHPVPLTIPDGTTAHSNPNMLTANTKKVLLFREVKVVEQTLMQQIVTTVKEAYLTDIRDRIKNSINDTMLDMLTQLQDNYGQLMPCDLLKRKCIVKKTNYHTRDPIATVLSSVKELLEFSVITGTSYTQEQAVNMVYVGEIAELHLTGRFNNCK